MRAVDSFSASYAEARDKFLTAARANGATIRSHEHPLNGPDGEALAIDTASFGDPTAVNLVVLLSGTHGVEGYVGSAAQIDWLRRGSPSPTDIRLLMVHAVNPFGFAWTRRVTHENVDLNRNWVDFTQPLPVNGGYEQLHEPLCPTEWTEEVQAATLGQIQQYAARYGMPTLQDAISAGQYGHSHGLFFGGTGPCWSRSKLEEMLKAEAGTAERVIMIDFHSGLGLRGQGELISLLPPHDPGFTRARHVFGASVGNSVSALVSGEFLAWAPALLANAEVTTLALEFGTVDVFQVLHALRADNWLHTHGDPCSREAGPIRAAIRAAFYDEGADWQAMVIGQAHLAIRQALAGLRL